MTVQHERARLGGSDLTVSRVVLGGMAFTRLSGLDHAARIVDRALELGITTIDTAPLYDFGASEVIIGDLLRVRKNRLEVLTKVGLRLDSDHGDVLFEHADAKRGRVVVRKDSRPGSVRIEVERSLQRLGLERLDLVQVHQFDRHVPLRETMGALVQLQREGKLRAIGVSNFTQEQVQAAIAGLGDVPLASLQSNYSLIERTVEQRELADANRRGIAFLAYSPLGQGLLAGRMLDGRAPPNDYRSGSPNFAPRNLAGISEILRGTVDPIAEHHGVHRGTIALAWLLGRPGVTAVIAGASSVEQVSVIAAARSVVLNDAQQIRIGNAFSRLRLDTTSKPGLLRRIARKARRVAAGALHLRGK